MNRAGSRVGFEIGSYDRSRTLIIDPVLGYSTYLGGSNSAEGQRRSRRSTTAPLNGKKDLPRVNLG